MALLAGVRYAATCGLVQTVWYGSSRRGTDGEYGVGVVWYRAGPQEAFIFSADILCDVIFAVNIILSFFVVVPVTDPTKRTEPIAKFSGIAWFRLKYEVPFQVGPAVLYYMSSAIFAGGRDHTALWTWWLASVPRVLHRLLTLRSYFHSMETNLEVCVPPYALDPRC